MAMNSQDTSDLTVPDSEGPSNANAAPEPGRKPPLGVRPKIVALAVALVLIVAGGGYLLWGGGGSGDNSGSSDSAPVDIDATGGNGRPPAFGVQFHGTWDDYYSGGATPKPILGKQLDQLAANRVALLRVDVGWSTSQPQAGVLNANSTYNKRIKVVLREAAKRNLRVMLTVWRAPGWAKSKTQPNVGFPGNPESVKPWATWMAKTFGDQVYAWQVWNEPNIEAFTGIPNENERAGWYVPFLKATSTALRAGDPDAKIIFGGPAQNDDVFIRKCYELGAKDFFDVMAVHPYQGNQTREPEAPDPGEKYYTTHFATVAAVMAQFGDGEKPVWWTEFGYSVHSNANVPADMSYKYGVETAEKSGDFLRRAFELARTKYPQVEAIFVYTAYREGKDPYGHESGYSLLNADGTPKAQLPMIRDYLAKFDSTKAPGG